MDSLTQVVAALGIACAVAFFVLLGLAGRSDEDVLRMIDERERWARKGGKK